MRAVMLDRSRVTFEARASFALGAVSLGAEALAVTGAWLFRALSGDDVMGFCRTSLASASAFVFISLRLVVLVGTLVVPLLVVVGLVRGGPRRNMLPGLGFAVLLVLYVEGVRTGEIPHPPRHPCLRSDVTEVGAGEVERAA